MSDPWQAIGQNDWTLHDPRPQCGAVVPDTFQQRGAGAYGCTLPRHHDMPHMAGDCDEIIAVWDKRRYREEDLDLGSVERHIPKPPRGGR